MEDVTRPERDKERGEVLDEQRDPDREPVDREEVEPLHEREPADPEQSRNGSSFSGTFSRPGPVTARISDEPEERPVQRTSVSRSDETPESRITFDTEAVDGPERRRRGRHRVAEPGPPVRVPARCGTAPRSRAPGVRGRDRAPSEIGMAGFEPAASCSQSRRSNQAELHPARPSVGRRAATVSARRFSDVQRTCYRLGSTLP